MTQATTRSQGLLTFPSENRHWTQRFRKPAVEERNCANCPFFNEYQESNRRGWCDCFNHYARAHHEMAQECVLNGALDNIKADKSESSVSDKLEDNLTFFPEVEFDELELDAFPSEELIDPYDLPYSEYEVGSIVKVIDPQENHTKWGIFEVVERRHNQSLYENAETYLQQSQWYYLLSSIDTAQKLGGIWVRENEICHRNESHLICTNEDIF